MRKSLSVIGSFCLGIGLSIAVLACADDNQHPTSSPEIHINDFMPTILGRGDGDGSIKYNYDDSGRLIGAKYDGSMGGKGKWDISYSGTTITIIEEHKPYDGDYHKYTHTITVTEEDIENVQAYNLAIFLKGDI